MPEAWRGRTWASLLAALLAALLATAACGSTSDEPGEARSVTIPPGEPVRIGLSISSIPVSELLPDGETIEQRIAQAAELAGRGVRVGGRPVQFVRDESACAAEGAAEAAQRLVDAGVAAVVGPLCSPSVIAAQPVYEEAGIPHVSPSSPAVAATDPQGREPYPTFFRVTYNDAIQGPALAQFAEEDLGASSAYVVFDSNAYGQALRRGFEEAFGGQVVGSAGFDAGTQDFGVTIADLRAKSPDIVLFAGFFTEAVPFITQLRAAGLDVPFLSPDGVRDERFVGEAGASAEGAYVSLPAPELAGTAYEAFASAFQEAYGVSPEDAPFAAETFDAATVVVEALQRVAVEQEDGSLRIDLALLREAIASTDLEGVTGRIRFDEKGDNVSARVPVAFFQVQDGEFREITALQGSQASDEAPRTAAG